MRAFVHTLQQFCDLSVNRLLPPDIMQRIFKFKIICSTEQCSFLYSSSRWSGELLHCTLGSFVIQSIAFLVFFFSEVSVRAVPCFVPNKFNGIANVELSRAPKFPADFARFYSREM